MANERNKAYLRKLAEQVISAIVVTGVLLFMFWLIWGKLFQPEFEGAASYKRFDSNSGLKIVNHRERRIGDKLEVIGTFENSGDTTWSSVNIEVELFNDKGEFVDECTEYVRGSFAPGASENFKVSCGGCKEHPLPDFATYTIRIVDASSF